MTVTSTGVALNGGNLTGQTGEERLTVNLGPEWYP